MDIACRLEHCGDGHLWVVCSVLEIIMHDDLCIHMHLCKIKSISIAKYYAFHPIAIAMIIVYNVTS